MVLSIVIPAFEESQKIARDIRAAADFLARHGLAAEIIVVDDGSKDETARVAENVKVSAKAQLKVIRYPQNRGKGFAIRTGVLESQGEFVAFVDSGLCVPYEYLHVGLALIRDGVCEIAHASRKLDESRIHRSQVWYRRITAKLFRRVVNGWMKIPAQLSDTQCGFKIYKGEIARELYRLSITDGFMFDVEIILRAQKKGYRIKEFPIEWTCDRDSRLSVTRSPKGVLSELKTIKRAL